MRGLLLLPVLVCVGCGRVETRPSGESLDQKLRADGNPASWIFHVPPEKVVGTLVNRDEKGIWKEEHVRIRYWHLSGDGTRGLASDIMNREWRSTNAESAGGLGRKTYYQMTGGRKEFLAYRVKLDLVLKQVPDGTEVTVLPSEMQVDCIRSPWTQFPKSCYRCICILRGPCAFDDSPAFPDGPVLVSYRVSRSDSVEEYAQLLRMGDQLGEKGMPPVKYPEIEVIP